MYYRSAFLFYLILFLVCFSCKEHPDTTTEIKSVELINITEEDPLEPPPPPLPRSSIDVWGHTRLKAEDSAALKVVWEKFVAALDQRNVKQIKKLSLPLIDCINLSDDDVDYGDWFIPIDTFIHRFAELDRHIDLLSDLKKGKFRPFKHVTKDVKSKSLPGMREKDLILYELSFVTLEPNEEFQGHEGANMIFQFVKWESEFKFYGMYSIP